VSDAAAPQSPLRRALAAIESLEARLETAQRARHEPIAIVGIGCRFPGGADSPEAFWRLLRDGVDAVREVPADRWDVDAYYDPDPDAPGRMASRWGAFVDGIDRFDPGFFGITPREAAGMDPQQRLLLEVAWEALENAGIAPTSLAGSATGVFVGIVNSDYEHLSRERGGQEEFGAYFASGNARSVASGRISYVLGLQGPSVSVDTACSSSLVAVHQAVQSLRAGECGLALAGGVNAILTPESSIAISRYRMLSPDGRCKTFDAAADGFARGEGCGIVVLKRLSDALADGDRVLALIRGSAVNQDGASSGLTAPNGPAQEAVIRRALADGALQPHEVGYVEAHGTGTSLGDPVEVQALAAALGAGRPADRPLLLGSVKTNLGHLESAAGIAGLIKLALCLQHGEIPPHLHLRTPNPLIPWDRLPVRVPRERTAWREDPPRHGGVSSFGFSGTNAHLVLGAAPDPPARADAPDRPLHLVALSGRGEAALRARCEAVAAHLKSNPGLRLADVAHTAGAGRAHASHRLAVSAASTAEAEAKLADWLAAGDAPGVLTGEAPPGDPPKVAFLFTGQGAQYIGMGRQLWDTEPRFRATLERCDALLRPHMERPLLSVLFPAAGGEDEAARLLEQTAYTQPALFALEYALADLWQHCGIRPHALLGHSVGEYVAACIAGVFTLEEALELVAHRGRLMQALPGGGAMAAVFAPAEQVEAAIRPYAAQLSIAAHNAPGNTVVSGDADALERVLEELAGRGVQAKRLRVSHAFHSPRMEPVLERFRAVAERVAYRAPRLRVVSNRTGQLAGPDDLTRAEYWVRHLREPVRFREGVEALRAEGVQLFLEVGPGTTLLGLAQQCLSTEEAAPGSSSIPQSAVVRSAERSAIRTPQSLVPSLRPGRPDGEQLLESLGALYVQGCPVDFAALDAGRDFRPVSLPTYPFQRRRYWVADGRPASTARPTPAGTHPLLGRRLRSALAAAQYESEVAAERFEFVGDHVVQGTPILPAAGFVELALAAAGEHLGAAACALDIADLVILEPLVCEPGSTRTVQTIVETGGAEGAGFRILSQGTESEPWRLHATGRIEGAAAPRAEQTDLEPIRGRCTETVTAEEHRARMGSLGLTFGPAMHGVETIRRRDGEALGRIRAPDPVAAELSRFRLHPALLDACLQVVGAAIPAAAVTAPYLPLGIDRVRWYARPPAALWSHVVVELPADPRPQTLRAEVRLLDEDGRLVAEVEGLSLRRGAAPGEQAAGWDDWLYRVAWRTTGRTAEPSATGAPVEPEQRAPAALAEAVSAALPAAADRHGLAAEHALFPRLESLCARYAADALLELGLTFEPGRRFTTAEVAARCGIVPRYGRLLERLLEILDEVGLLARDGESWEVRAAPDSLPTPEAAEDLVAAFPQCGTQIRLAANCGAALAEVLAGRADPLALLFPGGSLEMAEQLYREAPKARVYNELIAEAVRAAIAGRPDGRLRVLEIGAGTGATSASVLPTLPPERSEYVFTDLSPAFLAAARERFAGYDFVDYRLLDIERTPAEQGFGDERFDLVLAVNVLHATADLARTLRHVRSLVAPGGLLVVAEGTGPERWIDITFGLTDGWWRFTDTAVRPDYPLLPPARWAELLSDAGFEATTAAPADAEIHRQAILLARAPAARPSEVAGWLLVGDGDGVAERLAASLEAGGQRVDRVSPEAEMSALLDAAGETAAMPSGIVLLHALDAPPPAGAEPLESVQRRLCSPVLETVRVLASRAGEPPRLWIVTRGAKPVQAGDILAPQQSTLWGLTTVLREEHPELRCVAVDLDPAADPASSATDLAAELLRPDAEDRVAWRGGERHVARLVRQAVLLPSPPAGERPGEGGLAPGEGSLAELDGDAPVLRLQPPASGVLEDITWLPAERSAPGPGEVEIRVHATGLNFRDVMNALGMRRDGDPLGGECSGTVVAVGPGVEGLAFGDEVIAVAAGGFATRVAVTADLVLPKPAGLGHAEAAGLPLAFLTAYHCLHGVARIRAGERILIHAGAGGVGLAAVRLARAAGAEVLATAGSERKREFLRSLGVEHVFDSRSLGFADAVLEVTGGRGVDVVLNSLAGDFIPRSLEALAEDGRFVEIGKREIWTADQVAAVRPRAAYHVVDLAGRLVADPAAVRPLFREAMEAVLSGGVDPLPVTVFAAAEVGDAFRYMAQARHIGKVVVTPPVEAPMVVEGAAPMMRRDGAYLVTGGLGGLGLLTARWLAARGAGALMLMGRRPPTDTAATTIREIESAGAAVRVVLGDVSRAADLQRALDEVRSDLPPLRGIVHSAGVLEDRALIRQEWDAFGRVLAPKVDGAWLLHTLTLDTPLDFFVMFSSVAALLGSPGQASHAAANAFLDMLAHRRRAEGRPALSIGWGVWSEVGSAAARGMAERLAERGVGAIDPASGLRILEHLMATDAPYAAVQPVDWQRFAAGTPPALWLAEVVRSGPAPASRTVPLRGIDTRSPAADGPSFRERLQAAPSADRPALLFDQVHEQVARVIGLRAGEAIDPRQPLNDLGVDSLMAVELRNRLGVALGLTRALPATLVFDHPTLHALTDYLGRELLPTGAAAGAAGERGTGDVLEQIEGLSDEEVERLFAGIEEG
jgi:acyl transferase domain-containing protein/NADP-dependent 3-hydroxy acid dehydrogenase YdfG